MSINEIWNWIESQISCALFFILTKFVKGKNTACNGVEDISRFIKKRDLNKAKNQTPGNTTSRLDNSVRNYRLNFRKPSTISIGTVSRQLSQVLITMIFLKGHLVPISKSITSLGAKISNQVELS